MLIDWAEVRERRRRQKVDRKHIARDTCISDLAGACRCVIVTERLDRAKES